MFTADEKTRIRECYAAAFDRITNTNVKCFEGHKKAVFLISDTYPGVWLEHAYDSVFLAKLEPQYLEIAQNTLCLFLDNQKENGQLPCFVTDKSKNSHLPEFGYSQIQECVSFTRLCYEYYEMSDDVEFLRYAYDRCVKWQKWQENTRMPNRKGLIEMFCGYDTGHDNSCRMAGMKYPGCAKNKDAGEYPQGDDVLPVTAPDMNGVYYGTLTALGLMAEALNLNEDAEKWRAKAEQVKAKLLEVCFNEEDCFFYDVDKNGKKRKHLTVSVTNILSEHLPDQNLATEIITRHFLNPEEFYTEVPFPAVAKSDMGFKRNKSGNSWNYYSQALTVLRCTFWMDYYGFSKEFDQILEKWVQRWAFSNTVKFGQELDPFTGEPSDCSEWYSSCMLVFVYAVKRLGILDNG